MLSILCSMTFISLTLFSIFNHPLLIISSLILQTISLSFLVYASSSSMWFFYITFLILIGGLLIVFIYLSAIIPNEIFLNKKVRLVFVFFSVIPISFLYKNSPLLLSKVDLPSKFSLLHMPKTLLLIFFYLIFVLTLVIYLSNILSTPLKQKIYDTTKNSPPCKNY